MFESRPAKAGGGMCVYTGAQGIQNFFCQAKYYFYFI